MYKTNTQPFAAARECLGPQKVILVRGTVTVRPFYKKESAA